MKMNKQNNPDQTARHVLAITIAALVFIIYTLIGWSTFLHKPAIPEASNIVTAV